MKLSGHRIPPLRLVLCRGLVALQGSTVKIEMERLECGHLKSIPQDFIGATNAARRRCRKCFKGVAMDFDPLEYKPRTERGDSAEEK